MYTTSLNPRLRRLVNNDDSESVGQHAPLTPVTLQGVARDVARIPRQATHFCWVYPPAGLTQLSAESKALLDREIADGDPEHSFFAFGGFVYFRLDGSNYQMLQANALIKADNGLTFEGPFDWRPAYTAQLARDGRFQVLSKTCQRTHWHFSSVGCHGFVAARFRHQILLFHQPKRKTKEFDGRRSRMDACTKRRLRLSVRVDR